MKYPSNHILITILLIDKVVVFHESLRITSQISQPVGSNPSRIFYNEKFTDSSYPHNVLLRVLATD